MRHRESTLDPAVEAELAELDRAVSGEGGTDPRLRALVEDVRSLRTEPDPAFLSRMEQRVREGFPESAKPSPGSGRGQPGRWSRWLRPRVLAPAAGLLAAAVVAIVVVAGAGDLPQPTRDVAVATAPGAGAAAGSAELQAAPANPSADTAASSHTQAAPAATPAPIAKNSSGATSSPSSDAAVSPGRRVERDARVTLSAPRDRVNDVSDAISRATVALGGYVANAEVSSSARDALAALSLRVPSARLDEALSRFGRLARVTELSRGSSDITATYATARQRLADARAERRALLRALDRATTAQEIATLRERLRGVRSRIASRASTLEAVRRRADFATVSIEIHGRAPAHAAPPAGGSWTPGDALHDAGRALEVAAGVAIIAAAALVPAGVLAALSIAGLRVLRRRRREVALDRS